METRRIQGKTSGLNTPCFLVDEQLLENNCKILSSVQQETGCKILLALKAFGMHSTFPMLRKYLSGVCASGVNEARLGREKFKKEVHTFSPAYTDAAIKELQKNTDYIIFNSFSQLEKFRSKVKGKKIGLRINPEYSEVQVDLYNPCAPCSRLGILSTDFLGKELTGVSGLHFHVMCEQGADTLERVLEAVEKKFGKYLSKMEWVNFGGGHHITKPGYDLLKLKKLIVGFQQKYKVQVYFEPGEAIALNTGVLVASVLDIVKNKMDIAILDTSAETHMPDVLAMPYRPEIVGAGQTGEKKYTYRLGGMTCLAGDVIGDYSFDHSLQVGERLIFIDMAHYSMVKTTTFNGVNLPSILLLTKQGKIKIVKRFGYKDYMERLS